MKRDNLHYDFQRVDSYNKPYNLIISPRCAGKSTALWLKCWKYFSKEHKATIVLKRKIVDIMESGINDIGEVINKFMPRGKKIKLEFKKGNIKDGIVDVNVNGRLFLRFVALSNPMSRIKSMIVRRPACMVFDEYIVNVRAGEKYDPDEWFKILEIYRTYNREAQQLGYNMKCYFCGNPYSAYSPMAQALGVDMSQMKMGNFIVGDNYVIDCYQLKPELVEALKDDPTADFDEYRRYSFAGLAINDANFRICPRLPDGYKLKYVFRISRRYLGVYKATGATPGHLGFDCGRYWLSFIDYVGASRKVYAVDFDNLVAGSVLLTPDMKYIAAMLKGAIARRDVAFASISEAYAAESIYALT